ncbi:hypothetical protein [Nonomuraea soli]|uniref:Uncharacterized protein n=1 Tax=Nonomuraea soli TaxID=1032476 RepID=A0A7W0CNE9_9ACTN|nr:hypothetical protein [Nonomuraea soli]MBA2894381.1 hypothetical protein [Nonomuraea soli]
MAIALFAIQVFRPVKITNCGVNALDLPVVEGTVVNISAHKATVRVGLDITDGEGRRIDAAGARPRTSIRVSGAASPPSSPPR